MEGGAAWTSTDGRVAVVVILEVQIRCEDQR